jgi:hypothetical protein
VSISATTMGGRIAGFAGKRRAGRAGCRRCGPCRRKRCAAGRYSAGCTTSTASLPEPPRRVLVCVADGSEVVLGAPPSTDIAKPAALLAAPGVAVTGHLACADHGPQATIVYRIRPCVGEAFLAGSWDGVLAADRAEGAQTWTTSDGRSRGSVWRWRRWSWKGFDHERGSQSRQVTAVYPPGRIAF